ncbi:TIR domain-containing protein [Lacticaseibacillus paracasei]|uniref:TIR domain-containing protein n=1 Tax=Lacticaseibacillus paracasei TaxID=1597 RepID=UPI0028689C0F|nr:TIR domain-containing protein [Lacticaseibacillus paracasei]WMX59967.1 hypothetical protein RF667_12715 [Lacticaseibacillus paracasei]
MSWSGEKSKRLANSFKVLLINSLGLATEQVFISDTSIGHGDDWWMKIKTALSSAKVGIVFVTADNSEKPWLNYEAGILQAKFGENNKLIPVSTSTEFPKIDGKTPLRRFQFCKQIDKQQDALQLCKTIANYLDIDPNYLNRQFKANWEEFRKSLNIVDEKYINFKKMLSFWIPLVQEAWRSEGHSGGFPFDEIMPESNLPNIHSNVKSVADSRPDFKKEFLQFDKDHKIAIKFTNGGRLAYAQDTCITWVPNTEKESWFIKIVYYPNKDPNKQQVKAQYLATTASQNDDPEKFRDYMEKHGNYSGILISDLDLKEQEVNVHVQRLYNEFRNLITACETYNQTNA